MEQDQEIKEDKSINILLLGETGVGKSTFINSIANYLTYHNFSDAEKGKLISLIPSRWAATDKSGETHVIQIGNEDQNECLDTGKSATQDVKSYVFPIQNGSVKLRFIDTPGIGDGRGIDQDNINCENILSYIGQLRELHAIFYFFKPTNSRITIYFEYCMSQILSRLDKSASKNIIFIFTNTRGADYGPGDTYLSLKKVIENIRARPPYVQIPFGKNVFCFDNEAFRYLASAEKGIEFIQPMRERNCASWKHSYEQCERLIKYIIGDDSNPPLEPHLVQSTNAVNEARRLIVQLAQPLAEIFQNINDNMLALDRHKTYLDKECEDLDELRKSLYVPSIDIDVIKLDDPVLICASKNCIERYKIGHLDKWHFRQICHDPCYLRKDPKETTGSSRLLNCERINVETGKCLVCQCDYSLHIHAYYLTKTVEVKEEVADVKKDLDNKEKVLQRAKHLLDSILKKKGEYEYEHETIVTTCALFAHFLQNNAIAAFHDSYKEYIEYLIVREQSQGALADRSTINHLQRLLHEYEEEKKSFDKASSLKENMDGLDVTPQKIHEMVQGLYKLTYSGGKIRELYECQKISRSRERLHAEYVHEASLNLKGKQNRKRELTRHASIRRQINYFSHLAEKKKQ